MTVGDVEKLMLIETDADPATEVPFSRDNAVMLMQNSAAFDSWINQTVFHLDTFRSSKRKLLDAVADFADKCIKSSASKMTKQQYLILCGQWCRA